MYELRVVRERKQGYGDAKSFVSSSDVWEVFRDRLDAADREQFNLLLLDNKNKFIGFHVVSIGSLTSATVHPREVLKVVILANAAAFIALHNHPSGDPSPSREDLEITRRLRELAELLGVRSLDHIIFGTDRYLSLIDAGFW